MKQINTDAHRWLAKNKLTKYSSDIDKCLPPNFIPNFSNTFACNSNVLWIGIKVSCALPMS